MLDFVVIFLFMRQRKRAQLIASHYLQWLTNLLNHHQRHHFLQLLYTVQSHLLQDLSLNHLLALILPKIVSHPQFPAPMTNVNCHVFLRKVNFCHERGCMRFSSPCRRSGVVVLQF